MLNTNEIRRQVDRIGPYTIYKDVSYTWGDGPVREEHTRYTVRTSVGREIGFRTLESARRYAEGGNR